MLTVCGRPRGVGIYLMWTGAKKGSKLDFLVDVIHG